MKSANIFLTGASIVVLGALAAGLSLIDSPQAARLHALDAQRVESLQRIEGNIRSHYKSRDKLPEGIDQLSLNSKDVQDPVTNQSYEYRIKDAGSYELCAAFDTTPKDDDRERFYGGYGGYGNECASPWRKHGQGRVCHTVNVKECK